MSERLDQPRRIFWVRPDAISDNVLAAAMLPHVRTAYPDAEITVFCQDQVAELYQPCPFVDEIVTFNLARFEREASYREALIHGLQARGVDLCLNSVYSRSALTDFVSFATQARRRVAFVGGLENMPEAARTKNNSLYTDLIPNGPGHLPELVRHGAFLRGIGIDAPALSLPMIWLTDEDEQYAEALFRDHALDPSRTVALFAGSDHGPRQYQHFGAGLGRACREEALSVIALGSARDTALSQAQLDDCQAEITVNLAGKTTVRQAAAIIRRCRIAVGGETGLAHVACALGTPNVVLVGGGTFGRFMPYAPTTAAISVPLDCHGCNWNCHFATAHCVHDVEPHVIEAAVRESLQRTAAVRPRVFVPAHPRQPARAGLPQWRWPQEHLAHETVDVIEVAPPSRAREAATPVPLTSSGSGATSPLRGYARAVTMIKQGRTEEAAAALRALLENERLCAMVRNDLGAICYQQGHKEEAAMHFERALFLDPSDVGAHKNLADLYVQLGRHDDAIAVLRRAATLDPRDEEIATLLDLASGPVRTAAR